MDKRLKGVAIGAGLFSVIVFALAGFFSWRSVAYVDTFHARLMGESLAVTAPVSGRVLECETRVGDTVAEGDQLAIIETYIGTTGGRVAIPLRAPADGIIVQNNISAGEAVAAGQQLLLSTDPSKLWVEANINESRIARVKVGQPVDVRVSALKISFTGQVEQISRATTVSLTADGGRNSISSTANVEVPVRIRFNPDGYRLLPGMSVEVRIRVDPRTW